MNIYFFKIKVTNAGDTTSNDQCTALRKGAIGRVLVGFCKKLENPNSDSFWYEQNCFGLDISTGKKCQFKENRSQYSDTKAKIDDIISAFIDLENNEIWYEINGALKADYSVV